MRNRDTVFFTAINILNYLDRYLVAAVLPLLTAQMALSNKQGGLLVSAFVVGYFICSPVFGWLGDRFNRPKLMAFGVFLWSLATIATGFTESFTLFLIVRMFVGVGEASFGTIAPGYLKDVCPSPARYNSLLSVFFCAIPVGSALGYVLGGIMAEHYSWHAAFFVGGLPGLVFSCLLLRYPEIRTRSVVNLSLKEGLRKMLTIPVLWFAIIGYVLQAYALSGAAAFISKYGVSIGFELEAITSYFGLILVVSGFVGTVGGGKIASMLAAKSDVPEKIMLRFVGVTALLGVPFLVAAFLVSDQHAFLGLLFVGELLVFAGTGPVNAVIMLICPDEYATLTQGVTIFLLNLFGALLSPIAVGYIADTVSLQAGMLSTAVALFGASIVWILGGMFRLPKMAVST